MGEKVCGISIGPRSKKNKQQQQTKNWPIACLHNRTWRFSLFYFLKNASNLGDIPRAFILIIPKYEDFGIWNIWNMKIPASEARHQEEQFSYQIWF